MEWEIRPPGLDDQHGRVPSLPEMSTGPGTGAGQGIAEVIVLLRQFPAWAVWLPHQGRVWTAVRPASAQAPGPDLPMVWVQATTAAELADRMRDVDAQFTGRER